MKDYLKKFEGNSKKIQIKTEPPENTKDVTVEPENASTTIIKNLSADETKIVPVKTTKVDKSLIVKLKGNERQSKRGGNDTGLRVSSEKLGPDLQLSEKLILDPQKCQKSVYEIESSNLQNDPEYSSKTAEHFSKVSEFTSNDPEFSLKAPEFNSKAHSHYLKTPEHSINNPEHLQTQSYTQIDIKATAQLQLAKELAKKSKTFKIQNPRTLANLEINQPFGVEKRSLKIVAVQEKADEMIEEVVKNQGLQIEGKKMKLLSFFRNLHLTFF